MRANWPRLFALVALLACSGGDRDSSPEPSSGAAIAELTEVGSLTPNADGSGSALILFMEPTTGFMTDEIHDADREVVHFDGRLGAMVASDGSVAVAGWSVSGGDLHWSRSGASFRVRFGTEQGERRAYFTETGPGTICNLNLAGPDQLFISPTSEKPPNP